MIRIHRKTKVFKRVMELGMWQKESGRDETANKWLGDNRLSLVKQENRLPSFAPCSKTNSCESKEL